MRKGKKEKVRGPVRVLEEMAAVIMATFLVFLLTTSTIQADVRWVRNGVPVCRARGNQQGARIASTTDGGAIVVWEDSRREIPQIYAQKIDSRNNRLWNPGGNGRAVSASRFHQTSPSVATDNRGCAIIVWEDYRNGDADIYAQKLSWEGNVMWRAGGVPVCTAPGSQSNPKITQNGFDGAYIVWEDQRGRDMDIYGQRVDEMGNTVWPENETPICAAPGNQWSPEIACYDPSFGHFCTYVTWIDSRSGNADIYSNIICQDESLYDEIGGLPVCTAPGDQFDARIATVWDVNAIITWVDRRNGRAGDIYAQKMTITRQWGENGNGVPICVGLNAQRRPRIVAGIDGAIIAWEDYRSGNNWDIYAQYVDFDGRIGWRLNGTPVWTSRTHQLYIDMAPDGAGGAVLTWVEYRNPGATEINARKINARGMQNPGWPGAIIVCDSEGRQSYPRIVTDGAGGAFVTWEDNREPNNGCDIYATRISE